jgi:reductive dehalogenase
MHNFFKCKWRAPLVPQGVPTSKDWDNNQAFTGSAHSHLIELIKRRGFDELYPLKDSYKRHTPQKSKRVSTPFGYKTQDGKKWRIERELPGFSLLDYAFRDAAYTANHQTDGTPKARNQGYYSWMPLGVTYKPEGVPRWGETPDKASSVVAKAAKYYGAIDVGFCEIDRRWFFSHTRDGKEIVFENVDDAFETDEKAVIPESHCYGIVMTVPIDFEETQYTPTPLFAAGGMAYSRMHILAGTVAEFVRGLGYHAIPSGNDMTMNVPLAIQAGLGHAGRFNRLITWERGPLVKICKVFTDLPLKSSLPAHSGILKFCKTCKKCAKHCPSGSIYMKPMGFEAPPTANQGIYRWYCDEEKCRDYWDEVGTSCTICFRVCAFSTKLGLHHDIVKWFIRNVPQLNRIWAWSDDLLGYGIMKDPKKYWD